jgi:hypothetical protein
MNPRKLIRLLIVSLAALAATGLRFSLESIGSIGSAFANPINITVNIE